MTWLAQCRLFAGDIHHRPWTLPDAEADIAESTMAAPLGIALDGAPLVRFARRQDVVLRPLRAVAGGGA